MKVRSHAPRQFPAVKGSFTTVNVSLQPHLLLKEMSSHSLCSGHAFLLFMSLYTYNTEHLRLSCTFVVDTLLKFPTLFNKILTYTNIPCVNTFNSFGISDDHWTDFLCCRCCFSVLSTFVASFCGAQVVLCARLLLVDATRPRIILNSTPIHFVLSFCLHVRKRSVYRFQWDI